MPSALALAAAMAVLPAPEAPAPAPAFAERVAAQIALSNAASDAERALYQEALRLTLKTETGRSLAESLLATGRPAIVAFTDLQGKSGMAQFDGDIDRVFISRDMLSWKPETAGPHTAMILAHELLGHVLAHTQATAAGAGWEASVLFRDEVNACVVGWLVGLEAGWRFLDPSAEALLADREAFEKEYLWVQPAYAASLTAGEAADPVGALRRRLADPRAQGPRRDAVAERLAYIEGNPEAVLSLQRYLGTPGSAAFDAALSARIERLRRIAPPPPGLQSLP